MPSEMDHVVVKTVQNMLLKAILKFHLSTASENKFYN